MNTTAIGRRAEARAAEYLASLGYTILERNWRTRWCEIDIIASRGDTIYFVEVKYRGRNQWGSGLDHITPRKVRQIRFAAELWIARHRASALFKLLAVSIG